MPLSTEYEYYISIKEELLRQFAGKFALIKDKNLAGTYDTDQDAYKAGLEKFGNTSFLIVQVLPQIENRWVPAVSLGLLNASV